RNFTPERAEEALLTPGGAYYRVKHREIRDMHAAIYEAGIIYCTLMVHEGWDKPTSRRKPFTYVDRHGNIRQRKFPVIEWPVDGVAEDGHAIAIAGYTHEGFIIQNSWGPGWGEGGFALLPYDDYMINATDVWVAQLGVPIKLDGRDTRRSRVGISRASHAVPLNEIRPFAIDVGNNGKLSSSGNYWTTEEDLKYLFEKVEEKGRQWEKNRLLLYLHGGLSDEESVARRIVAFRDVLLENEIYPVHIMWETGFMESLKSMIADYFGDLDARAGGVADWLNTLREGLIEAKDRSFELTVSKAGTGLWNEMKENAELASNRSDGKGGMQLLAKHAKEALKAASKHTGKDVSKDWELHVVAHSAGSIYAAYAMSHLIDSGVTFKSLHLMAPAITIDLFKESVMPLVKKGKCPQPSLYILSDVGERDDNVKMYGKSLLYLVSNAFEGKRETPLLGMERFVSETSGSNKYDKQVNALFKKNVDGLPSLVIAGKGGGPDSTSRSDTHGGFDNDEWTLNSILWRVLGKEPKRLFKLQDLQY
ncbi:MAG TPA: C1 family peptidase, partial [Blastocatellia bacterium]|nr:C1 family peptidase [Blastocatellia bacterium]